LLIATTFVVVNLIVDLLYAAFDPRSAMSSAATAAAIARSSLAEAARMFKSGSAVFGLVPGGRLGSAAVLAPLLAPHDLTPSIPGAPAGPPAPAPGIPSAPTSSAAICSAGCPTARAPRSWSGWPRRR
jgi:hypothetical protein